MISLFKYMPNISEMPDKTIAMRVRFLEQNNGTLSQRAKTKELSLLSEEEVKEIENHFKEIFERQ